METAPYRKRAADPGGKGGRRHKRSEVVRHITRSRYRSPPHSGYGGDDTVTEAGGPTRAKAFSETSGDEEWNCKMPTQNERLFVIFYCGANKYRRQLAELPDDAPPRKRRM